MSSIQWSHLYYWTIYTFLYINIYIISSEKITFVPKCSSSHHLCAVILAMNLPSPILSRVKLSLFHRSHGAMLLALAWLWACSSKKFPKMLLQNKAVGSVKRLSLTSVGIWISPNSGNQPGNMQSRNNDTSSVIPITQIFFFFWGRWEGNLLSLWRVRNRVQWQQKEKKTTAPSENTYSLQCTNMHHRNNICLRWQRIPSTPLLNQECNWGKERRDALDWKCSPRLTFWGFFGCVVARLEVVGRFRSKKRVLWGSSLIPGNK